MLTQDITSTLCLKNSTARARLCDTCPATMADLACDSQIHAANKPSSRARVMCDACEQAPAAFICNADAASLCATCDAVIHSANPLSRRHHRVPVMPVLGSVYGRQATEPWSVIGLPQESDQATLDDEGEDEAASWLVFDSENSQNQNEFLFNGDDQYLEVVDNSSCQDTQFSDHDLKFEYDDYKYMNDGIHNIHHHHQQQRYGGCDADRVVPVQSGEMKKYHHHHHHHLHHHKFQNPKFQLGMEYETFNGGYGYSVSLGASVSMSSMEVGTLADSRITEVSISNTTTPKGTMDLSSNPSIQMPTPLTSTDREARVLRYREKKKTRKFEKTIRYASRKAYAEKRPRIQGRFAKRTNVDIEMDQMFSTTLITEDGYCTVPLF